MREVQPELDEAGAQVAPVRPRMSTISVLLSAVVVLAVLAVASVLVPSLSRSASAPGSTAVVVPADSAAPELSGKDDRQHALRQLLETRSRAVATRDQAAWLGTVDRASADFVARQSAVFDRLAQLPLESWRYDLAGNGPSLPDGRIAELGADEAWVARVVLEYQLRDSGAGAVRREQYLTVVQRDDRWLLAGDSDGRTAVDLWDLGEVHVARGSRSLVLGTAEQTLLDGLAQEVDHAAAQVDAIWGTEWPRTVLVMVPRDQQQMAALLGRDSAAGLEQIAAVTTGEVGVHTSSTSADRVIINPDGFAQLGPLGREVVLRHEITHVATRATTTTAVPIWLSEGLADYVAYARTGLGTDQILRDLLPLVRSGRVPEALPTSTDFDPVEGNIAPAYAGAWLAAHMIEERIGERGLIDFYRTVAAGPPASAQQRPAATPGATTASQAAVDSAFASLLGTDPAQFTADWRAEMIRLAEPPRP